MKRCTLCLNKLPIAEFPPKKRGDSSCPDSWCYECHALYERIKWHLGFKLRNVLRVLPKVN